MKKRVILSAAGLLAGVAPELPSAQGSMELQPVWDAAFDSLTAARLSIVDQEVVGARLFLAIRRDGDEGFSVRRMDALTGALVWDVEFDSPDVIGEEEVRDLAAAPDGRAVYTIGSPDLRITRFAGKDGAAQVVDVIPGGDGRHLALTPDGRGLVAAGGGMVALYERATLARRWLVSVPPIHRDLAADGRRAYVLGDDEVVALSLVDGSVAWSSDVESLTPWSLEKGRGDSPLVVSGFGGSIGVEPGSGAVLWTDSVLGDKETALDRSARRLFRTSSKVVFTLPVLDALDVATGQVLWSTPDAELLGLGDYRLAVSDDGTRVAVESQLGARVYDAATGAFSHELPLPMSSFTPLLGPGDGQVIAVPTGASSLPLPLVAVDALTGAGVWTGAVAGQGSATDRMHASALAPDGSRFFLAGEGGATLGLELCAFDTGDGELLWSAEDPSEAHPDRIASDGQRVFLLTGDDLAARDGGDGAPLWKRAGERARGLAAAPDGSALYDIVAVPKTPDDTDYGARRIDPRTGAEAWYVQLDGGGSFDVPGAVALSPDGATVFVAGRLRVPTNAVVANVAVTALDAATGAERWHTLSPLGVLWNALEVLPAPDGRRVFVLAGRGDAQGSRFLAYDAATGAELWASPVVLEANGVYPSRVAALSADGSRLVGAGFGSFVFAGHLTPMWSARAVDTATGAALWDRNFTAGDFTTAIDVVVAGAAPTAVVCGQPGPTLLVGFDLADGSELWHAPSQPAFPPGGVGLARIAAAGRLLVAQTRQGPVSPDFRAAAFDVPTLVAPAASVSLAAGGEWRLRLRAGPDHGGEVYAILASTGAGRGLSLPGGAVLPLAPDEVLALAASSAAGLRGLAGELSPAGEARGVLTVPAGSDPSLAGVRLRCAALALGPGGRVSLVTNPVELELVP